MTAYGEALLAQPWPTPEDIKRVDVAVHNWYDVLFKGLAAGFQRSDQDELNLNIVISRTAISNDNPVETEAKLRERITTWLDILEEARRLCR
jgi:hypothetical protein